MSHTGMTAFCGTDGCKQLDSLGSSTGTVLGLSAPVGSAARCRNTAPDVRKVQAALNRFTPLEGGPGPALVVDGKLGPLTLKGVTGFQKKHFGLEGADGVIDPGKRTDKALCSAAGTYADLPAEMQKHRARAMHIINLARMSVDRARYFKTGKPNTWGIGKSDWDKAAKHFQIDKFPGASGWSTALGFVDSIYLNMQTALGYVPRGLVLATDEPVTSNEGAYAFTFAGGYDLSQRNQNWNGIPRGSIYLCARMQNLDSDAFSYVLIHETAHYVGPVAETQNSVTDYAYAHRKDGKYQKLLPWQRTHNADCYAQHAFDAAGIPFDLNAHLLVSA